MSEKLATVDIKGKDYVMVNERVRAFKENYKGYGIKTEMLSNENGTCVFKAEVVDDKDYVISTGHAYEKEGSSFINKTSYIENCETSAVGRALGFLGIGIDTSIASYEEVGNAVEQQNDKAQEKKDEEMIELEKKAYKLGEQLGIEPKDLPAFYLKKYGARFDKATEADLRLCIADMSKKLKEKK